MYFMTFFFSDDKNDIDEEYSSDSSIPESDNMLEEEEITSSINSATSLRLKLSKCSLKEDSPLPLLKSLFANKPPTLYFTIPEEQGKDNSIPFNLYTLCVCCGVIETGSKFVTSTGRWVLRLF